MQEIFLCPIYISRSYILNILELLTQGKERFMLALLIYALLNQAIEGGPTRDGDGYLSLSVSREQSRFRRNPGAPIHRLAVAEEHEKTGLNEKLKNAAIEYRANFTLGTPGQDLESVLDTGSSDLWVYGAQVNQTKLVYNSNSSTTSRYVSDGFEISYVGGVRANGKYYSDVLTWGNATLTMEFAVTNQYRDINATVFGIGPIGGEATLSDYYSNFPTALREQGLVSAAAYSLHLNEFAAKEGTLLLGAVDHSKYTGQLYTIPFESDRAFDVSFSVDGKQMTGVLDTGTTFTYLPTKLTENLALKHGAVFNQTSELYVMGDDEPKEPLVFNFSGCNISIPPSELFVPMDDQDSRVFGILPDVFSRGYIILGDTFLRSAYVVYDIDNGQAGIAQAKLSPGKPDIELIDGEIPGAKPAPYPVSRNSTQSGGGLCQVLGLC